MNRRRHERLEELFNAALERETGQREHFLDEECASDPELRAELEALLRRDTDRDWSDLSPIVTVPMEDPEWIGSYRILRRIGEGGFAVVYEAEQTEPVRRRVAVKVLKPGVNSESIVARFDAERQALAVMNHASIARVFDAGRSDSGSPYFVMELVDGPPIQRYCEENRLALRRRVELMIEVCQAVHHAHQKGVIHRDLKPSNILVTTIDGRAVPKVIDFGIAKASGLDGLEGETFTRLGQFLGTPEYCSPEQAEAGERDIDTRTDVYSLGVVLYELLTGQLPFPPERLQRAGIGEILRVLREVEPPRPSTRVRTLSAERGWNTSSFGIDARTLARRLRGELDWIVLKTLEKQRARRYQSAHGLAEDLSRFLRGEAVVAGPPSARYRAGKFVRRYRVPVILSALLVLSLGASAVISAVQARRVAVERDRANLEAQTTNQVADFLSSLFEFSDPGNQRGRDVSARDLLDRGAERVEGELKDQPLVQARLLLTMGRVYRRIHEDATAIRFLEKAVEIRAETLGVHDIQTVNARASLAIAYAHVDRRDEAEILYRSVIDDMSRLIGADHPSTLRMQANLANLYSDTGRGEEALLLYQEIHAARLRVLGPDDKDTLYAGLGLGMTLHVMGRNEEAEPHIRESVERLRVVRGEDHPNTLEGIGSLGEVLFDLGRVAEAVPLLEEALAGQEKVLGKDSPEARKARDLLSRAREGY